MLTYNMKDCGSIPKYIYLYRRIREDILEGRIKKGEKLPSKRTLANHLNVGVITVANAYAHLITEGFISSEEKRGYFVQDQSLYGIRKQLLSEQTDPKNREGRPGEKPEPEYFADFKANRTGLTHFPATRGN